METLEIKPADDTSSSASKAVALAQRRRSERIRQTSLLVSDPKTTARYEMDRNGTLRRTNKPIGNKKVRRALRQQLRQAQ